MVCYCQVLYGVELCSQSLQSRSDLFPEYDRYMHDFCCRRHQYLLAQCNDDLSVVDVCLFCACLGHCDYAQRSAVSGSNEVNRNNSALMGSASHRHINRFTHHIICNINAV